MSGVDLVQWLGEQLDAEAEEARLTADAFGAVWTTDDGMESVGSETGADVVSEPYAPRSFIAEHDPARVLREIDAKRRILDTLQEEGGDRMFADIFRLLALPYADRPGYQEALHP